MTVVLVDRYIENGFVSVQCEGRDAAGRSMYYYIADASIANAAKHMELEYQLKGLNEVLTTLLLIFRKPYHPPPYEYKGGC